MKLYCITRSSYLLRIIFFVVLITVAFTLSVFSKTPQVIQDMLKHGFSYKKSLSLYSQWTDVKDVMIQFAKSRDPKKIALAQQIVEHKFIAWEQNWTNTTQKMIQQGYKRPIDAMAPTGGWKAPLTYKNSDPVRFIIDGANADIDATFFSSTGTGEEFVEQATINWAKMTGNRHVVSASGVVDYPQLNTILRNSEITPFPRHPNGRLSDAFKKKFPEIVHEGYPGPQGQRALEQNYLMTNKGKADILVYDKNGNLKVKNGKPMLVRNQPAVNVIENVNKARYTIYDKARQLDADIHLKYKGHLEGINYKKDAETTAKMLQRIIEGDAGIKGYPTAKHPLYKKAKALKQALRDVDDEAVRRILGNQSLDDFMKQADGEIMRINTQNKNRIAAFADDNLGIKHVQNSRLNTALKALTVIGYGTVATDAYMKAKEGEKAKEVAKALTAALAGDVAGMSASALAGGGATGFVAGVGVGMVAGVVVYGGVQLTDQAVKDILGGYKTDATIKNVFLTKDMINKFVNMSPDQIKKILEKDWDEHGQWGGTYYGKMGDKDAQEKLKQQMFEKALQAQSQLNYGMFKAKAVGEIVRGELDGLVQKYENDEISAAKYSELQALLTQGEDKGAMPFTKAWRYLFGTDFDDIVQARLKKEYPHLKTLFDQLDKSPEKDGLWNYLTGKVKDKDKAKERADNRFYDKENGLLQNKEHLGGAFKDFDRHSQALRSAIMKGKDQKTIDELFNNVESDMKDLLDDLKLFENGAATFSMDLNASYGKDDDLSKYYSLKSELSKMLLELSNQMNDKKLTFEQLKKIMEQLKVAHDQNKKEGKDEDEDEDDKPSWARKSDKKDDERGPQKEDDNETKDKMPELKDDYRILSIAVETVEAKHNGKLYQRLKHSEAATIVIRMRGKDYIIDGQVAVSILMEKKYCKFVQGVGIVVTSKIDTIVTYEDKPEIDPFGNPVSTGCAGKPLNQSCRHYRECSAKLGARLHTKKRLSEMSSNEYWEIGLCRNSRKICQDWYASDCGKKKKELDPDWQKKYFKTEKMNKKDAEMFGGALLGESKK